MRAIAILPRATQPPLPGDHRSNRITTHRAEPHQTLVSAPLFLQLSHISRVKEASVVPLSKTHVQTPLTFRLRRQSQMSWSIAAASRVLAAVTMPRQPLGVCVTSSGHTARLRQSQTLAVGHTYRVDGVVRMDQVWVQVSGAWRRG